MRMQPSDALAEMLAQDREARDEPSPPGPPAPPLAPIVGFQPPAPDWRAEERERVDVAELEPSASLQPRPAPKRRRSTTPNLDQVRGWKA